MSTEKKIDYQKHRERMDKVIKGKRYFIFIYGDGIRVRIEFKDNDEAIDVRDYPYRDEENEFSCGLVNDAKELLDKAEKWDSYTSLKDALDKGNDKIKDGPSEEDREELEGIIYTLDTDGVCGRRDARWMADKLKPLMGIK